MKPRPTIRNSSRRAEALGTFRVTRLAAAHAISVAAMITTPPMVGVPRLTKCAVGPSWRMNWPYCLRTRYRMNSGVASSEMARAKAPESRTAIMWRPSRWPRRWPPGWSPHDRRPALRRLRPGHLAAGHAAVHPVPRPQAVRPVHPPGRPDGALHQAGHPHHGRRRDHRRDADRVGGGEPGHPERAERLGPPAAVPDGRSRLRRVPRRLHQDLPAAQPRPEPPMEVHRPGPGGRHVRGAGRALPERELPHAR